MHFRLHHTASGAEKSLHACTGSASAERVGQGGGWGHPQGDMHMVAAMLGPDCMGRLRKHYFHLVEHWFLARKAAWALTGCLATDSAEYCKLVKKWVWSKSRLCLLMLEVDMDAVLESELGQK